MIRIPENCPTQWLTGLLDQTLESDQESAVTRHLESCPTCRERLQSMAADDAFFDQAKTFLSDQDVKTTLHPWQNERSGADGQIRRFLPHLEPSANPGGLGRMDQYEIHRLVGWGGMGIVLQATDPSLSRPVAIKVLHPHLAANGPARHRFNREARAAAAVNHASVVPIHSVDADHDPPYLVMAYVPGGSLQDRIDANGPLDIEECLRIGLQIAEGLAAAHRQGLVHRDIKPANILLDHGQDRAMLTDFGLAQALDDAGQTCSGTIAGTPQFMSPEQARGLTVDARSDVFSLGSVFYAMLTGRPPFRGESSLRVLTQIQEDSHRPLSSIRSGIPMWLERLVHRMLAKDRSQRIQSADEAAELIRGCLSHHSAPHDHPVPSSLCVSAGTSSLLLNVARFRNIGVGVLALAAVTIFAIATQEWLAPESDSQSAPGPAPVQIATPDHAADLPAVENLPDWAWGDLTSQGSSVPLVDPPSKVPFAQSSPVPPYQPIPPDVTAWDDGLDPVLSAMRDRLSGFRVPSSTTTSSPSAPEPDAGETPDE
ncbi:serine/threonine-protein kinase [Crateriforma conspicua]|uniref:non-specific serine/threonine protein kinase n=1 Tax=Crateriforma conspicua TaxID=2527996 RepID=A0A5C6FQF2_9PLAN|nr:serine/threonine-protein kinase [Crateriforma conspicua]TWU65372.1 Serine/threonine-protein kinase PknB [Crateriforma conspicua]